MQDLKGLVLEAAHSFLIHSPWVPVQKQLKWADVMYSAITALESLQRGEDATEEIEAIVEGFGTMIYTPIDNIADAYRVWMSQKNPQGCREAILDLSRTLEECRQLCLKDSVQAKRNLIGALNKVFDHLNKIEGGEQHVRIPFREEIIN